MCFLRVHFSFRIDLEVQQEHLAAVQILLLLLFTWHLLCLKEHRDWRLEKVCRKRGKTLLSPKSKAQSLLAPTWLTIPSNKADEHGVSGRVSKAKKIACAHKMEIKLFKHLPHATVGVVAQDS